MYKLIFLTKCFSYSIFCDYFRLKDAKKSYVSSAERSDSLAKKIIGYKKKVKTITKKLELFEERDHRVQATRRDCNTHKARATELELEVTELQGEVERLHARCVECMLAQMTRVDDVPVVQYRRVQVSRTKFHQIRSKCHQIKRRSGQT